jgi:hypothetical protein
MEIDFDKAMLSNLFLKFLFGGEGFNSIYGHRSKY